jgi:hypothetical protein
MLLLLVLALPALAPPALAASAAGAAADGGGGGKRPRPLPLSSNVILFWMSDESYEPRSNGRVAGWCSQVGRRAREAGSNSVGVVMTQARPRRRRRRWWWWWWRRRGGGGALAGAGAVPVERGGRAGGTLSRREGGP